VRAVWKRRITGRVERLERRVVERRRSSVDAVDDDWYSEIETKWKEYWGESQYSDEARRDLAGRLGSDPRSGASAAYWEGYLAVIDKIAKETFERITAGGPGAQEQEDAIRDCERLFESWRRS
jgi:hypothetical protein